MTCKLVCLLVLGFAALAYSTPLNQEGSDEADLTNVELIFDDDDEARGIFTNDKGNNRCTCSSGNNCGCCASPRIPVLGKYTCCLNVTVNAADKTVDVSIESQGKVLIQKTLSTAKAERVCDRLPGFLDDTKICVITDFADLPDKSGIQACPKIDVMQGSKTVAKIAFACVQFKDEQISLNDNGDVKANDLFSIKTGNPIKGVLNWLGLREPSNKN